MRWGKKLIRHANSFSDKLHQQKKYSGTVGVSISRCDMPKQVFTALVFREQYMAISMPGHGDSTALMSRITSSLTLWIPTV